MPPLSTTTDEAAANNNNNSNGMLLLQQSIEQSNISGISLLSTTLTSITADDNLENNNELLLSLSSSLTNKISMYKSKLDDWSNKEREVADAMIETYQSKIQQEQQAIDAHVNDLVAVQAELGSSLDDNNENESVFDQSYVSTTGGGAATEQQQSSIASRKLAMERQHETLANEILKLQADVNDRNTRIKGTSNEIHTRSLKRKIFEQRYLTFSYQYYPCSLSVFRLCVRLVFSLLLLLFHSTLLLITAEIQIEESKQSTRAEEARELKNRVKESKQTTIDDLTRGIINYKHLGLDFQKAEGENNLR